MNAATMTREERTARLADLRAREAARKVVLSGTPLMDLPLERRIAFAMYDPGAIVPRGDNYREPLHRWAARAVTYVVPELDREKYVAVPRWEYELMEQQRERAAKAEARVAELMSEGHLTVADVVAWLVKKAHEYGVSNRENRAKAEAVGRMADKISRGAIRPTEGRAS